MGTRLALHATPARLLTAALLIVAAGVVAPSSAEEPGSSRASDSRREECTVVTVGKKASADGSVMTSHTCDSHRTRSEFNIIPAKKHKKGAMRETFKRIECDTLAMPSYAHPKNGEIPEVEYTFGYINTAYPCMNDQQLGIGESTFGGRESLKSDSGLIDCEMLVTLVAERCRTAREAVKVAGELSETYGWIDEGECLSFCDPNEAWIFEIVGPGKGRKGAIWAAERVPDDHISVNANGSRIRAINLDNPEFFMAANNFTEVAQDSGWWKPADGPFEFCYAYDPDGRRSFAAIRREWRVFELCAPSLKLNPNSNDFPFSVKPDTLVSVDKMVRIFQDYYEGTDFNPVKDITWVNGKGVTEISPLANPFMPYDMNKLFKINGGWGWRGERTIARWYTMYATITQSRDWLPPEVGGLVWMAMDNVATSIYVPIYCSVTDVSDYYETPGRDRGYTHDSAWWAFNRLGTLAAQRWGDMRHDVTAVWGPWQRELLANQARVDEEALRLHKKDPKKAREYLTKYGLEWGDRVVDRAWKLGDELWTKYDEKF